MASNTASKVCEAEGNACKKDVQALCYHCSKNICRRHLMQHAQLIEEKTRAELHSLADQLNELSSRFNHLSISDDILQKPLDQLEKWRVEAHEKIDQIAENKRRELNGELEKCRKDFSTKNEEQLLKLNASKKVIAELIQEADASATQIEELQESINETEKYLNALDAPVINVIARSPKWLVDICTTSSGIRSIINDRIREFKITYVRLNGILKNYYIKTKENGKIFDLIKSFVGHCTAVEEFTQFETNELYTIDHLPKSDSILSARIYNHRFFSVYNKDTLLDSMLELGTIVFYETPYSLSDSNNPRILMPCLLQHKLEKKLFGFPIYVSVPRTGCRGQDVRDSLHDTLDFFFQSFFNGKHPPCETYLRSIVDGSQKNIKLDDVLQDEIDFTKVNATLILEFDSLFVSVYKEHFLKQFRFNNIDFS